MHPRREGLPHGGGCRGALVPRERSGSHRKLLGPMTQGAEGDSKLLQKRSRTSQDSSRLPTSCFALRPVTATCGQRLEEAKSSADALKAM